MVKRAGPTRWLQVGGHALVAERLLRTLTILPVVSMAGLAFVVSFEAISALAVATGAFPPSLGWCAPLLVDSFTAAATLVIWSRSLARLGAGYARTLVAAATAVSLALNVAHAPDRLAARLVAALPPLALLAAVELVMSEARRALAQPGAPDRTGTASLPAATASTTVLTAPAGALTQRGGASASPASPTSGTVATGDTRTRVTPSSPAGPTSPTASGSSFVGGDLLQPPGPLALAGHPHAADQLGLADVERRDPPDELLAVVCRFQHPVPPAADGLRYGRPQEPQARAEANPRARSNTEGPTARLPASDLQTASPATKERRRQRATRPDIHPRTGLPAGETSDLRGC
jgi:Protein of unknown function (DUF2637)